MVSVGGDWLASFDPGAIFDVDDWKPLVNPCSRSVEQSPRHSRHHTQNVGRRGSLISVPLWASDNYEVGLSTLIYLQTTIRTDFIPGLLEKIIR